MSAVSIQSCLQVFKKMKNLFYAVLSSALLVGCSASTTPTEVQGYNSPVDAQNGIRSTHYHGIIGEYNHREPVDPRSWRKLNEEQSPKNGEG